MTLSESNQVDFVTIVFSGEIELLRLQARSMAKNVSADLVGEIIVVINDADELTLARRVENLRHEYGPHRLKLRVCRPHEILSRPRSIRQHVDRFNTLYGRKFSLQKRSGWRGNPGWLVQQALKILAVRVTNSDFIVVLDAKNLFLREIQFVDFVDENRKPKTYWLKPGDKQRKWVDGSFEALAAAGLKGDGYVTPTITPLVFDRRWLSDAANQLEAKLGLLDWYFVSKKRRGTEFMLLFAIAETSQGGSHHYFGAGLAEPLTVFTSATSEVIDRVFDHALAGKSPFFSVHRRQFSGLSSDQTRKLSSIWKAAGVANGKREAEIILATVLENN